MKTQRKTILIVLILFLMFLPIITQISKSCLKDAQNDVKIKPIDLKSAGFWDNFTYIHITNLNWTIANETEWCSGSGTYTDPFTIENMIINATYSPIGCGILIQNSIDVYFKIENVTIYGTSNGIKLENTNNGDLVDNYLLDNLDSGINMINCANNTLLGNTVMNNGLCGINLTSYCYNNKILGNTVKNQGTNLQDTGINLRIYCNNNDILGNTIYDNNVHGINIENDCQENEIINNTIKNMATNQQDYGVRLHSNCDQNTISSNVFEDLNNYGIYMVTSDQNSIINNQIIDCGTGMYMLIDSQSIITNNLFSGGSYGILMSACDGGEFADNFINETVNFAIRIFINSDNNEFHDNIIKDNANVGIQLDDSSDTYNDFYNNGFISNGIHAYDNGTTTTWNNSVIGNYWDDYSGTDANNDNIGDTPYDVTGDANASDALPLYDNGAPVITINSPTPSSYEENAPDFNIYIDDPYIYSMWYTINNSVTKYYFTENGTINEASWDSLTNGNIEITFFIRDIAWNVGSNSVNMFKGTSQSSGDDPNNGGNPPFDLIPIIIIISAIAVAAALLAVILIRRSNKPTDLPNKSKILNKEQLAEAHYFKDITSILIILAIHKESGLALSKIALHGGIGLDENLFTGFISAMGSFKDELAKQMGLHVRDEGGDNVIEYNEFTITIMDGEFLRLGLVSYNSLGAAIKQQCGEVLRAYEVKHMEQLKNFDGDLQTFKDFEDTIGIGLNMNLNKKCIINVKQLNKYDAPEPLKIALHEFYLQSKEFYPLELSSTLIQKMNISEQEANSMVYNAYKHGVFIPAD